MKQTELIKLLEAKNKRVIIFDFDGTIGNLIIDWTVWFETMAQFFNKNKNSFDWQTVTDIQNQIAVDKPDAWVKEITEYNYFYEKTHCRDFVLLSDSVSLIKKLASKYELYVWSLNDSRNITEILDGLDLLKYFKKIIGRDSAKFIKPNPEGFTYIWDKKLAKSKYLFIGDARVDEMAAQAAGIDFLYRQDIN